MTNLFSHMICGRFHMLCENFTFAGRCLPTHTLFAYIEEGEGRTELIVADSCLNSDRILP